jgi:hypothetical protein
MSLQQTLVESRHCEIYSIGESLQRRGIPKEFCDPDNPSQALLAFVQDWRDLKITWDYEDPENNIEAVRASIIIQWKLGDDTFMLYAKEEKLANDKKIEPRTSKTESMSVPIGNNEQAHRAVAFHLRQRLGQSMPSFNDPHKRDQFNIALTGHTTNEEQYPGIPGAIVSYNQKEFTVVIKDCLRLEEYVCLNDDGSTTYYGWMKLPC